MQGFSHFGQRFSLTTVCSRRQCRLRRTLFFSRHALSALKSTGKNRCFFGPSVAVPFFEFRRHFMGAILIISIVLVYVFLCATSGIESVSAPAKKSTTPPARKN